MDRLSELPDDVLIKIQSYLPLKTRIMCSVLAKRYEHLWKYTPNLRFVCRHEHQAEGLRLFLNDRLLPNFRREEIRGFVFSCDYDISVPEDITNWVQFAVNHRVKRLHLNYNCDAQVRSLLPNSMFRCISVVRLCLSGSFSLDLPDGASLPSLRYLQFEEAIDLTKERLLRFLSVCPVLKSLVLGLSNETDETTYSVAHPGLLELNIRRAIDFELLEIHTPSLRHLTIKAPSTLVTSDNMPNLEEANITVGEEGNLASLISSISSVRKLTICVNQGMDFYHAEYNNLRFLFLCDCDNVEDNVFFLLRASPNVEHLEICPLQNHDRFPRTNYMIRYIPACTYENLQSFVWANYDEMPYAVDVLCRLRLLCTNLKTISLAFGERYRGDRVSLKDLLESFQPNSETCEIQIEY